MFEKLQGGLPKDVEPPALLHFYGSGMLKQTLTRYATVAG